MGTRGTASGSASDTMDVHIAFHMGQRSLGPAERPSTHELFPVGFVFSLAPEDGGGARGVIKSVR